MVGYTVIVNFQGGHQKILFQCIMQFRFEKKKILPREIYKICISQPQCNTLITRDPLLFRQLSGGTNYV